MRKYNTIFFNESLTIDEKFDILQSHVSDARNVMKGLFHNSKVHVDYIVELRDQIRELGGEPLPYPADILDEYIGD